MPLFSREKSSLKGRWRLETVQNLRSSSSNPVSCPETSIKIYGSKEEIRARKSPETVDAPGFAPDASIPVTLYGGELGIRTLETFRSTAFRVLHLRPLGQLSVSIFVRFSSKKLLKNSLERKQERRQKIFDFEIFCVEEYQGESGGRNSQLLPKFRVSPVMTTSIPLHMMQRHLFYYTPRKNARVWRKAIGKKAKLFAKNEKKQLTISV